MKDHPASHSACLFSGLRASRIPLHRLPAHACLLGVLVSLMLSSFPLAAAESADAPPPGHKHAFLLNSYHQGFRWTDDLTGAVIRALTAEVPDCEYYIEYLDAKRSGAAYRKALQQLLAQKFQNFQPDVIIVSDDAALEFLREQRDRLFPGVPVVFCGINNLSNTEHLPAGFYGLLETLDIRDNIDLARTLFPYLREIAVVTDGTQTGIGTRQEILRTSAAFPGLRFTFLNGEDLTMQDLLDRLRQLPADSVVIAPAWYQDKNGVSFTNTQSYPQITAASPVPVIATSAANMGLGLLGGKVNSGETQGEYAGRLAAALLQKKLPAATPQVETKSHNAYVFDFRQLQRFGVSLSRLPPASTVLFRSYSFYETYRTLVWAVASIFGMFLLLIVLLLVMLRRLHRTRHHLAASEENLRITLDSIGDAVISTDLRGRITNMNPVAQALTGCPVSEAIGKDLSGIFRILDALTRLPAENPAKRVLKSGEKLSLQRRTILFSPDGQERFIADSCAPIRNVRSEITGAVLVFRDITEEHLTEEKLRHSQKMDAIGQLAGGVAHDFNNMLGGILGGAEVLALKIPDNSELREHVNMIIGAAERAAALTEKLLGFSRKGKIVSTPIDVHLCVEDALSILERSLDKNVSIVREFGARASVIAGDPAQIQNAVINLGVNAGHAMPGGGRLTVSTCNTTLDEAYCRAANFKLQPGDYIQLSVRDTGTGIDPQLLPRIFEPFFTTREAGKGTGLGLSAVYGTVKDHSGCVTVYSEVGNGSVFNLYFPLSSEPLATVTTNAAAHIPQGGCILVIDDEQVIRTTALNMLEEMGYTVILAVNGEEGLEIYRRRQQEIDLILLDMVMPKLSGLACFHELRKINPGARVLISSGFAREGRLQELQSMGILGFIKKPYHRAELAQAIHEALHGTQPPAPPA